MKQRRSLVFLVGVCLVLILAALPLAVACAKQVPAPAPAPAPTPEKKWTFKLQSMTVKGTEDSNWMTVTWIAEEVGKRTNGRVKIDLYGVGEIAPWAEFVKATEEGTLHLFDLADQGLVADFPGIDWANSPLRVKWPDETWKFWDSGVNGVVEREANKRNLTVLGIYDWGDACCFIGRKGYIKTLDDFKGLKIRTAPGLWVPCMEALGAVPTPMSVSELYVALERGVIDAVLTGVDTGLRGWKTYEVCNYLTFPAGGKFPYVGTRFITMNKKALESLPADIQKAIRDATDDVLKGKSLKYTRERNESAAASMKQLTGYDTYIPPTEEVNKWVDKSWDKVMNAYIGKGGMAKEIIALWEKFTGKKYPEARGGIPK